MRCNEKNTTMKRETKFRLLAVLPLAALLLTACSGSDSEGTAEQPTVKQNVRGTIEKGPFVQGSKVALYDLDNQLAQTGKSYSTNTRSDLGDFDFGNAVELSSRYAELETSGFFYNECDSSLSKAQITLKALADVSGKSKVNVNLLTHLEYARVKYLVSGGKSFADAKKQAERELLKVFAITDEIATPESVSITDGDKDASILLAISSVMLYNKSEAEFSEFISKFSIDFESDGIINDTNIRTEIKEGQKNCHPGRIAHAMKRFYAEKGSVVDVGDFSPYVDFNGDGVIDKEDGEMFETFPVDSSVAETFWNDQANVQAYVNSMYQQAMQYMETQQELEAVRLGITKGLVIEPDTRQVAAAWSAGYEAINRGSLLLSRLPEEATFDTAPYVHQTKAIVAFVYYNMAMSWGNIPLVKPDAGMLDELNQCDAATVYAYCDELLRDAAPTATQPGMVNKDFVTALSAEIALAKGNKTEADKLLAALPATDIFSFKTQDKAIGIYTADYILQLKTAASADGWLKRGAVYGTWAALKRLGKAVELTGISEHELLLPIPSGELARSRYLSQNPGYSR